MSDYFNVYDGDDLIDAMVSVPVYEGDDLTDAMVSVPPQIVLLNGPPKSGKDLAGQIINELCDGRAYVTKFAKVLKERAHALYGLWSTDQDFESGPLPHYHFEQSKDVPTALLLGLTPRQVYIEVSERHFKRLHGEEVFGEILAYEIAGCERRDRLVVVTDSGFEAEARPLIKRFGEGRIILIRLHREGCSFEGDSRSYWGLGGIEEHDVSEEQNRTPETLRAALSEILDLRDPAKLYRVEVQVPVRYNLQWMDTGPPREDLQASLAAAETIRRMPANARRAVRVLRGTEPIALALPGDAPLYDLG